MTVIKIPTSKAVATYLNSASPAEFVARMEIILKDAYHISLLEEYEYINEQFNLFTKEIEEERLNSLIHFCNTGEFLDEF